MKEPKRSSALVRRETFASYCFLLPSLIFFLGFVIYPMILCVVTSFFDSTMNRADIFVGMANYKTLFADPIFLGALKNTFVIVIVSVPITCIFSLWVSSAIVDLPEWATSLFRCVFYLPVVTGSVAVTVVWKWMYNNYYGIFNYLGKAVGLIDKNINWLGDEKYALGCIILILLTTSVGQPIVLYVSALGNVDQSIVEAAEVDRPEIGQGQSHIRQHAPAALLGGLKGDAVVALVFLLLFFGGGHAVAAEERDKVGAAQLHAVFDDLFQFVLLGVARQQGDFHTGFGGAGVARFHAELHALVPEPGDGGGVLHSVAVT